MIEYVDLETAKAARGTRLVTTSLVPSPWGEAAKGCFRIAKLPVLVVHRTRDTSSAIDAWTGIDNVPALRHEDEPVRSNWAAIVAFIDRMARSTDGPRILPDAGDARADVIGTLHELAGEDGIGWNGRLAMIDAGLASDGTRGFSPPIAKYLAKRYGYVAGTLGDVRDRIAAQLAFVAGKLGGASYFGAGSPNALDVYAATFLTPIAAPISEADCPGIQPMVRAAFASAHEAFGSLVPPALLEHRKRMFASYLEWPIRL